MLSNNIRKIPVIPRSNELEHPMKSQISIYTSNSPIIATAIHDGHSIPSFLLKNIQLTEHERMREEDPYTAFIVGGLGVNSITVGRSRFMVDLNRPKDKCIYHTPKEAWGLSVWKSLPSKENEKLLYRYYDRFYQKVNTLIKQIIRKHGYFILLDFHSYNHRRKSPYHKANSKKNPEINIGTQYNLPQWHPVIATFISCLSKETIQQHQLDVRENVKFKGAAFQQWVCEHFGHYGCVLSIEFKKTFMDEWTGRVDVDHLMQLKAACAHSLPCLTRYKAQ